MSAFADPIVLHPRPSLWLRLWWLALHLIWLTVLVLIPVSPWIALALATLVAGHGIWRRPRWRNLCLIHWGKGVWSVIEERNWVLCLSAASVITPIGVKLEWQDRGRAPSLYLLRDQLNRPDWRRLHLAVHEAQRSHKGPKTGI